MNKLIVNLGDKTYPIYITNGYEELGKTLLSRSVGKKVVIITDENVYKHQFEAVFKVLDESGFNVGSYVIRAGEAHKNLDTVQEIYNFLVESGYDRSTTLIALGGGVVGDITGFVASTIFRGVNFVQIPTTLLSQADSSVGGKVGVDFGGYKNIVGAFYQPKLVFINVNSLKTLPLREIKSGLTEVVKHGIIMDADFLDYIDYNTERIFNIDENVLQYLAKNNCKIKANVVEQDEKESGLRAILNFGHTMGHAIETHSGFKLLHGEAVAIGIIGAMKMAFKLEMIQEEDILKIEGLLSKIGLPTRYQNMNVDEIIKLMQHDKKVKFDKIFFILPKKLGEVIEIGIDDIELIKEVLEELR